MTEKMRLGSHIITKVKSGEDMPGEFSQVHSEGNVQILKGSLKGVKVSLGMSDPVEKAN